MYDLIIIGAGPAGLSAAVYARRAGLELLVIEEKVVSGGQVLNTYEVDNYLGLPGISGPDMGAAFREHAERLGIPFREAQIREIADGGDRKIVRSRREEWETRTVLLATGAKHAQLGVPGEETFSGRGVSYCAACDGAFFQGKTVAVVGGGDVALEDAVYLARTSARVYLIHRRDELRGADILQDALKALPNVEILFSHVVERIDGDETVEALCLRDKKSGGERILPVDGVFIAVGIHPNTELLRGQVSCDQDGYVLAGEDGVTDRPGIFVAGDVRKKPLRQIVTAVADGANAAVSAEHYCRSVRKEALS